MIIDTKTYHVVKSQQFKFEVRPPLPAHGRVRNDRRSGTTAVRHAARTHR